MGRVTTPTYAIEYLAVEANGQPIFWTPAAWRREYGRPTAANLAKHVAGMEASTQPGGCNDHLGVTRILAARIVRNIGQRDLVAGYLYERTSTLLAKLVRGIPNDPEGIEVFVPPSGAGQ